MACKNEALEAAKHECIKANKNFRIEQCKRSGHWKMYIDGVKRVLIISNTFAIKLVKSDVRKALKGM